MRADIENALKKNKEANRLFSTLGFKKNYERIEKYLSKDETVLYARNANVKFNATGELKENSFTIKDKVPVIIVVTDKRMLIYYRIFFNEKLDQIPINEIRTYDFKRNSLSSSVFRVTALTKSVDIDLTCNSEEVALLNDSISIAIKSNQEQPLKNKSAENLPELLRELADLKRDGIITDEEFEKKKSELLAKI